MGKPIACFLIIISLLTISLAQKSESKTNQSTSPEIQTVGYCELISKPEKYVGKTVRLNATYRFGFEWSEFYCLDCWGMQARTWVEYEDELCPKSKKIKDNGFQGRTVNVQVVGKFYGSGQTGYGHMNAYQFQFVVSCVEKAKTIWNNSSIPSSLPADVVKKASCQTNHSRR